MILQFYIECSGKSLKEMNYSVIRKLFSPLSYQLTQNSFGLTEYCISQAALNNQKPNTLSGTLAQCRERNLLIHFYFLYLQKGQLMFAYVLYIKFSPWKIKEKKKKA